MTVITEIIIALAAIAFLSWWYYLLKKNYLALKLPGPPPVPVLGNILDFKSTTELLDTMMKYKNKYGGLVKVRFGPTKTGVLVSDYKFLEMILSSPKILTKSREYKFLHPWLGTGLLTSDGTKWKQRRRILTPTFHFQILEQFIEVFESGGNKMIEKLKNEAGKKSVDIYPFVTLCTLDIICETAMGTKINAQDNGESNYVKSVKAMCKIIIERSFSLLQMQDVTYPLSKNYYTQKRALEILHKQTNSVITKRRNELLNKNNDKENRNVNNESKKKKAFLDLLLEATVDGKTLTHEEIREEVDTFMFEGHDTTASAISFGLYCLANHPEVQKKALEEQISLFGDNKKPTPTYGELQSMKYLENVIKETLRIYPSVPFYGRKSMESIDFNGVTIPAGIEFTLFAYGIQRDPKYFKDPEIFNPDRFDDVDGRQPYAFIPFSAGPRNCIGQKFAMLEMKSTISKVIRNFELVPANPQHEVKLASEAVLKSVNGIKIGLKLRN